MLLSARGNVLKDDLKTTKRKHCLPWGSLAFGKKEQGHASKEAEDPGTKKRDDVSRRILLSRTAPERQSDQGGGSKGGGSKTTAKQEQGGRAFISPTGHKSRCPRATTS